MGKSLYQQLLPWRLIQQPYNQYDTQGQLPKYQFLSAVEKPIIVDEDFEQKFDGFAICFSLDKLENSIFDRWLHQSFVWISNSVFHLLLGSITLARIYGNRCPKISSSGEIEPIEFPSSPRRTANKREGTFERFAKIVVQSFVIWHLPSFLFFYFEEMYEVSTFKIPLRTALRASTLFVDPPSHNITSTFEVFGPLKPLFVQIASSFWRNILLFEINSCQRLKSFF